MEEADKHHLAMLIVGKKPDSEDAPKEEGPSDPPPELVDAMKALQGKLSKGDFKGAASAFLSAQSLCDLD